MQHCLAPHFLLARGAADYHGGVLVFSTRWHGDTNCSLTGKSTKKIRTRTCSTHSSEINYGKFSRHILIHLYSLNTTKGKVLIQYMIKLHSLDFIYCVSFCCCVKVPHKLCYLKPHTFVISGFPVSEIWEQLNSALGLSRL